MSETLTAPERWREKMKDQENIPERDALFYTERDGARWVFATNGKVLVAERSDTADAWDWGGPASALREVMAEGDLSYGEVSLAALRGWAGEPEYPTYQRCLRCDGDGSARHNCNCEYCTEESICPACGGTGGRKVPEERLGLFHGHLFDRNLVAQCLAAMSAETATTSVRLQGSRNMPAPVLCLATPTQRTIIMGMHSIEDAPLELPEFAPEGVAS